MLIALAATVLLAASWMMFLRPRAVESTTEQVTAPARVADKARAAAAATDKASAATEAATADTEKATAGTPAKGTTPAKGETTQVTPNATAKKAAAPAPADEGRAQAGRRAGSRPRRHRTPRRSSSSSSGIAPARTTAPPTTPSSP